MKLGWSPEIIAGRIKDLKKIPSVSYEAIFQYIYLEAPSLIGYLPRRHKKHFPKNQYRKSKRSLNSNKKAITERSEDVNNKTSFGHIKNRLNNRPRKCTGFQTPIEVFRKQYSVLAA